MRIRLKADVTKYAIAVVLVALATLLTRKSQPVLGEISPLFFVAVMLSAWFGGIGPGLFATAVAGFASAYFFYDIPSGSGIFGWDDALRLVIFLLVALLISFLLNMRRRAERQLRQANENLEIRILERTRELEISNVKAHESEQGFRALIEGVTDCAICLLDEKGFVVQWNSGARRIQGYEESEILHKHFSVFEPGSNAAQVSQASLDRAAALGRFETEGWRLRKDGSCFWASVIITSLHDAAGNRRGFAHVARDITQVRRLEREVVEISEQEQRRIGRDLHDGLGQELTGVAFLTQNVGRELAEASRPEASVVARISSMILLAIETTRDLARGLSPVEPGADGLTAALQNLAARIRDLYRVPCEFRRGRATEVESHPAAVHLYRIAQEALSNAARHSRAGKIIVSLDGDDARVILTVEDDGIGISEKALGGKGMGLHLMPYRARTIGATFDCQPRPGGGTIVRCIYQRSVEAAATPIID
jgi:two-component system CheB/CheR fusion protein